MWKSTSGRTGTEGDERSHACTSRPAAGERCSNSSNLISAQLVATVCAVNDDGDGDKNLGYDDYPDAVWDDEAPGRAVSRPAPLVEKN